MKSNKLYIQFFILLFTAIIVSSCSFVGDCEKVFVDNNQKKWFDSLAKQDTVYFRNQNDSLISFVIDLDSSFSNCNKFNIGPNIYQSIKISYEIPDSSGKTPIYLNVFESSNSKDENWSFKNIRVFELDDYIESDSDRQNVIEDIVLRDGRVLRTYYLRDDRGMNKYIKDFNWSINYGLVRFRTYQGDAYELVSSR